MNNDISWFLNLCASVPHSQQRSFLADMDMNCEQGAEAVCALIDLPLLEVGSPNGNGGQLEVGDILISEDIYGAKGLAVITPVGPILFIEGRREDFFTKQIKYEVICLNRSINEWVLGLNTAPVDASDVYRVLGFFNAPGDNNKGPYLKSDYTDDLYPFRRNIGFRIKEMLDASGYSKTK